ncbi:hypothetical protein EDD22DRAFT_853062 [Suillus occidentalis]|nr:hypothetical protein EDD22DRAFT_853062 [Suillus occidentalis]
MTMAHTDKADHYSDAPRDQVYPWLIRLPPVYLQKGEPFEYDGRLADVRGCDGSEHEGMQKLNFAALRANVPFAANVTTISFSYVVSTYHFQLVVGLLLPSLSSSLPPAPFYQMEDDQPHPVDLSRVDDILRASAASPIVVALTFASENAGQKQKMADLEDCDNLTSVHALKRETHSQKRAIIRQMISLLGTIEDSSSKNGCDKDDDDIDITLILRYVALKNNSDSSTGQHNYLHMSNKLKEKADGPRGDVNGNQIVANTLMVQAQQLLDDIQAEHHDLAKTQREMWQIIELDGRPRTSLKLSSSPLRGQWMKWPTDEELYNESSVDEGSPVAKTVGGPLSCGLAARRQMSYSRCWALRRLKKVKDTRDDADDSDESVTVMQRSSEI